jgi:hypothetical protein
MHITINKECSLRLSRMPIMRGNSGPICQVLFEDMATEPGDQIGFEAVLPEAETYALLHHVFSPEMLALKPKPNFDSEMDSEGSGLFHTEVMGPPEYIHALCAVAERFGAKRIAA